MGMDRKRRYYNNERGKDVKKNWWSIFLDRLEFLPYSLSRFERLCTEAVQLFPAVSGIITRINTDDRL
jgi:hypothetical protein